MALAKAITSRPAILRGAARATTCNQNGRPAMRRGIPSASTRLASRKEGRSAQSPSRPPSRRPGPCRRKTRNAPFARLTLAGADCLVLQPGDARHGWANIPGNRGVRRLNIGWFPQTHPCRFRTGWVGLGTRRECFGCGEGKGCLMQFPCLTTGSLRLPGVRSPTLYNKFSWKTQHPGSSGAPIYPRITSLQLEKCPKPGNVRHASRAHP